MSCGGVDGAPLAESQKQPHFVTALCYAPRTFTLSR